MKLIEVSIHNYRAIIDQKAQFQSYTLLIGANNSGKSTIIDAIRAFYEKDGFKYKSENDFPLKGAKDNNSWIELTFSLTDQEIASLKEDYQMVEKKLKVRKYFQTNEKLHDGKSATGSILGYKSNGELSNEPFYGAKNVQSGKFGDLIYIPAISKVDEHTKLSGPSALRDLITNIMSDVVEGSDTYKTLAESVNTFASEVGLIETEDKRSLSSFESDLNTLLAPWQTKFNLKFSTPSTAEIIKSMLGWDIRDNFHEKAQSIEYFGSGFQRHFIYSLIQLGAKYVPQKVSKKSKDFTPALNLVLFEEPEAFLHPPQLDELSRNLIKVSEADDWQVLCSSHSTHFVSRKADSIPAIVRVQRDNGIVTAFQICKKDWQAIVDSNQAVSAIASKYPKLNKSMQNDDLKPDMEAVKYFLWLNPDRASMFFAKKVLLVEGQTETSFINKLLDDGKLSLPNGTYILDCLGKYNIHRFMNLLSRLGVIHSVLHDDDENRDEHQELNQLIADSKKEGLTIEIKQVKKDLETFLGVTPPGSPHRKPQHLLFFYSNGWIDETKLYAYCELVQSCFPKIEGGL